MTVQRTTKIWSDTIRQGVCRKPQCRQTVWFAQRVKTKGEVAFDRRPVAIAIQPEIETTREQWTVDLANEHFSTCVSAATFSQWRPRR